MPCSGAPTVAYCLVEHKRTPGRKVYVQLLRYLAALYERLERQAKGRPMPVILALLVYNGPARWKGPRRFSELLDDTGGLRKAGVDFPVAVLDLGAERAARLSRHPTLKGGLLALKTAAAVGSVDQVRLAVQALRAVRGDGWTRAVLLQYLLRVGGKQLEPALRRAGREVGPLEEAAVQTLEEILLSRGMRKGLKKGLERGRREALTTVLRTRFKRLPAAVKARVAEADHDQLEALLLAAIDAPSLAAVFGERRD